MRHTLTEALLLLANDEIENKLVELDMMIKEVALLIDQVGQDLPKVGDRHHTAERLADSFIATIKQVAKPGRKIEE